MTTFLPRIIRRSTFSNGSGALPGGGFAFVMATGIISSATFLLGFRFFAAVLFSIDVIAFPLLSALLLRRLIKRPASIAAELSHHATAPGFLSFVAAVSVLGVEVAIQTDYHQVSAGLWLVGCGSWVALIYAVFILLITRPTKASPERGLNGSWLLVVVATEALAVLGSYVETSFAQPGIVLFSSLCFFLLGGFFYLIIITMILGRWLFAPLSPSDLSPTYWINMGAMAIATLAGSRLQSLAATDPVLTALRPSIAATTMLYWAVAAWWVPLLFLLMIWRHAVGRVPLSYRFEYWSMVFPLGMYTMATTVYADVNHFGFLDWIPRLFIWVAAGSWSVCFIGMLHQSLVQAIPRLSRRERPPAVEAGSQCSANPSGTRADPRL